MNKVERWGVFEYAFSGSVDGNPFTDYTVAADFTHEQSGKTVTVRGFYDGDGRYMVRFMPESLGSYTFKINADCTKEVHKGCLEVCQPSESNHGPVYVVNKFHFAYADGMPYYPFGTTCYVWQLQSDELIEKTFETLRNSCFNKIRFCVFPKHYVYNLHEPRSYPYEGTPMDSGILTPWNFNDYNGGCDLNDFDYTRFNPAHFRHIESCIRRLGELGIEADIILMHPYDRWGFSRMTNQQDELYLKYVVARFSAFRNVWWAMANEYDLMQKSKDDWRRYGELVMAEDKYCHPRSIHNCIPFYDHTEPWVTHCSIQRQDLYKTTEYTNEWRERFGKPVVLDEIAYEGNIPHGWGNISARELVRRYWEAVTRGGYPQHGETYLSDDNILWWSHGGVLKGDSMPRLKFLWNILSNSGSCGLKLWEHTGWAENCAVPEIPGEKEYYLYYYSFMQPAKKWYPLTDGKRYSVKIIDTWNMTVTDAGEHEGKFELDLPGKEFTAVEIREIA